MLSPTRLRFPGRRRQWIAVVRSNQNRTRQSPSQGLLSKLRRVRSSLASTNGAHREKSIKRARTLIRKQCLAGSKSRIGSTGTPLAPGAHAIGIPIHPSAAGEDR